MMEPVLVIIKPDAIAKRIVGQVLLRLEDTGLELIGLRVCTPTKVLAEDHYRNIKGMPFFRQTVNFFLGKQHKKNKVIALVYCGAKAVEKLRKLAGATNPAEADPNSIRGTFGRVSPDGTYENVIHVSSSPEDTRREIQLWFEPEMISRKIYRVKRKIVKNQYIKVWA